jgi:hypothetical protein
MKVTELLQEFARDDGDNRKPPRVPPRRGGDDDGDAKRISFKGETVFYEVSPVSWQQPGYGLQIKLSLDPHAPNAACEFVKDEKIDAYKKDAEKLDDAAIKLAFSWLNKNGGPDSIAKKQAAWGKEEAKYDKADAAEREKASKKPSPKTLPKGYSLTDYKGKRWVKTPDNKIIPRQDTMKGDTDADVIADFYKWYNRQDH